MFNKSEPCSPNNKALISVNIESLLLPEIFFTTNGFDVLLRHLMRTYRVDRMKDLNRTGEPRDGEEEFAAVDMKNYTQRVFGMFGGKRVPLTLLFDNCLLDTVIDRFGKKDVLYEKADDDHFTASLDVELSGQFYGWLCGFGNLAKIISPETAVVEFAEYLDKIREMY